MSSSKRYCCIRGCSNTPFRLRDVYPPVKFYSFPESTIHAPWKTEKRTKWIKAVKNYVKNPTDWEPTKNTKICSAHFINNAKSEHPSHPSYVPTIFHGKPTTRKSVQAVQRFERQERRSLNRNGHVEGPEVLRDSIGMGQQTPDLMMIQDYYQAGINTTDDAPQVTYRSITCQTDAGMKSDPGEPALFFCNLNNRDGICTAAVQVNIPTKRMADKMCDANLPILKDVKDFGCNPIDQDFEKLRCSGFHGVSSMKNDEAFSSLTGVSFTIFSFLLSILPDSDGSKMSGSTQLLITLMKLKTGLSYTALGVSFDIHRTSVQRTVITTLQCLKVLLKNVVFWPSKATVKATLPEVFKKHYPETRVIIDCTEVYTEVPSQVRAKVLMYSEYKHHHTVKFLVGCTPNEFVSFVSKGYGGRAGDCFITNDCGLIGLIEPGDVVLADKGFPTIRAQVENKNAVFVMPPFLHNPQFSPEEVEETYSIASVRIHIERIMQRIKDFHIFSKVPISLFPHVDEIIFVVCALINLEKPIIKQKNDGNCT